MADKRAEFIYKRVKAMIVMRGEAILKDCWRGWVHHLQKVQLARRFIRRALNLQLARGFCTWRDEVEEFIQRRRAIRKILLYICKRKIGMAFRSWALTTQETQEMETGQRSFYHPGENTYVDKKRNILVTWKDFVQREKYAVNIIGAIARRTLLVEGFQRIAIFSRQRFADEWDTLPSDDEDY